MAGGFPAAFSPPPSPCTPSPCTPSTHIWQVAFQQLQAAYEQILQQRKAQGGAPGVSGKGGGARGGAKAGGAKGKRDKKKGKGGGSAE
eukprot:548189-Prymnesium_polylepis.1